MELEKEIKDETNFQRFKYSFLKGEISFSGYLYALGSNLQITMYLDDDDVVERLNQAVNDLSINDLDDSVNGAIARELDEFEASNI